LRFFPQRDEQDRGKVEHLMEKINRIEEKMKTLWKR
jgi:hypothetical protein